MGIDKETFFKKLGYKIIPRQSNTLRNKSLAFIKVEFPEIENDIELFASKNNIHKGDCSAMVIKDVILPELQKLGGKG